jgi:DNA repair exonuclease SbcCD ATPase subunit
METKTLGTDNTIKDFNQISASASTGNIDKIRDILFGSQMRDYEKRFAKLEERLQREHQELKEEMRKRLESLEGYVRSEADALSSRITTEQEQRGDSLTDLSREMKDIAKSLEKKTAQLDELFNKNNRDMRQQALDQTKQLMEEIQSKHQSLSQSLERAVRELTEEKMERNGLADLFTEMAMRLNNQFHINTEEVSGNE